MRSVDADMWMKSRFGMVAFGLGATALTLVLLQFFAGPFEPQQSVGATIGEIAADIRQSAGRALTGQPRPEPVAAPWSIDRILALIAAIAAAGAIVLGLSSLIRKETRRPAVAGLGLGVAAVTFQFFVWLALLICGVILLVAIIENLGDILDGFG